MARSLLLVSLMSASLMTQAASPFWADVTPSMQTSQSWFSYITQKGGEFVQAAKDNLQKVNPLQTNQTFTGYLCEKGQELVQAVKDNPEKAAAICAAVILVPVVLYGLKNSFSSNEEAQASNN